MREALFGGERISNGAGCGPGELAPGEAHIPLSLGTKGNQEGSPWVEYITRRTGGTYPVVSSFIGHAFKLFLWVSKMLLNVLDTGKQNNKCLSVDKQNLH